MAEAVTLDLWYTLWYQTPGERSEFRREKSRVWRECLAAAGASPKRARTLREALARERDRHTRAGAAWSPRLAASWIGERYGLRVDIEALEQGLDRAVAHASVHLTRGAERFVAEMRRQRRRIGLVSNIVEETGSSMTVRLAREGMLDWFDACAISSEVGWAKPDRRIFLACLRQLGARPATAVHVGDLPADVRGARAAGMNTIWFWGADRWSSRADRILRRSASLSAPRVRTWTQAADAVTRALGTQR